jgi:predicted lipoprotein
LALVALMLTASCTPTDLRRKVLRSWGEDLLLPLYAQFDARLGELAVRIEALCSTPTEETLALAREGWWNARAPWKQAEVFAFGPFSEEPLRLGPKIDFWPARPENADEVLAGSDPITAETFGAASKGLPIVEYLLYAPSGDVAEAFAPGSRRCAYLASLVVDLRARTKELSDAWSPAGGNFLGELVEAGNTSKLYETLPLALGEIVNRMAYTAENIRGDKLGKPLGTTSGGSPQPELAESRWSGRSLQDIADNLTGIESVYFGAPGEDALGLVDYLHWRDRFDLDARMRSELADSRRAIDLVRQPLTVAITTSPARVQAVSDALGELQRLVQVDVIGALSLTVGFNDNDGD